MKYVLWKGIACFLWLSQTSFFGRCSSHPCMSALLCGSRFLTFLVSKYMIMCEHIPKTYCSKSKKDNVTTKRDVFQVSFQLTWSKSLFKEINLMNKKTVLDFSLVFGLISVEVYYILFVNFKKSATKIRVRFMVLLVFCCYLYMILYELNGVLPIILSNCTL